MSNGHVKFMMDHAEDLIPVLYDHARELAASEYRWREGKTLPLGKTPEDIVRDVYVSYVRGATQEKNRTKGVRHFDPTKEILFQLKGSIRSAMWALTQKKSAKNEAADLMDEDAEEIEFAPTDATPDEIAESTDFAKAVVENIKIHPKFMSSTDLQNLFAAFELDIIEVSDQAAELKKKPDDICQLRHQLRQIQREVVNKLNSE